MYLKVLIELYIPEIEEHYELYIPVNKTVGYCVKQIKKMLSERYEEISGDITVNLNKEGASCDWHLASLSEKKDNKEFNVSVYHNSANTYAQLDNYGVCRDEGKLIFSGICKIVNGSHGSKAHQNAKIMVFDEKSDGVAKPILKIDENDIEASHAAIVGKINDEHIFYLTSRGLSEEEAKRLITLGYLKPILQGFLDEDMKNKIESLIEGKM